MKILIIFFASLVSFVASAQEYSVTDLKTDYTFSRPIIIDGVFGKRLIQIDPSDSIQVYEISTDGYEYLYSSFYPEIYTGSNFTALNQGIIWRQHEDLIFFNPFEEYFTRFPGYMKYVYSTYDFVNSECNIIYRRSRDREHIHMLDVKHATIDSIVGVEAITGLDCGLVYLDGEQDLFQRLLYFDPVNEFTKVLSDSIRIHKQFTTRGHDFYWTEDSSVYHFSADDKVIEILFSDNEIIRGFASIDAHEDYLSLVSYGNYTELSYEGELLDSHTLPEYIVEADYTSRKNNLLLLSTSLNGTLVVDLTSGELTAIDKWGYTIRISDRLFLVKEQSSIYDFESNTFVSIGKKEYNYLGSAGLIDSSTVILAFEISIQNYSTKGYLGFIEVALSQDTIILEHLALGKEHGINAAKLYPIKDGVYFTNDGSDLILASPNGYTSVATASNFYLQEHFTGEESDCLYFVEHHQEDGIDSFCFKSYCNGYEDFLFGLNQTDVSYRLTANFKSVYFAEDSLITLTREFEDSTHIHFFDVKKQEILEHVPVLGSMVDVLRTDEILYLTSEELYIVDDNQMPIPMMTVAGHKPRLFWSGNKAWFFDGQILHDVTDIDRVERIYESKNRHTQVLTLDKDLHLIVETDGKLTQIKNGILTELGAIKFDRLGSVFRNFVLLETKEGCTVVNAETGASFKWNTSEDTNFRSFMVLQSDTLFAVDQGHYDFLYRYRSADEVDIVQEDFFVFNQAYNAQGYAIYCVDTDCYLYQPDMGWSEVETSYIGKWNLITAAERGFYFIGIHPTLGNQVYYLPASSDPNSTHEPIPLTGSPLIVNPNPASTHITIACPDCPTQPTRYEIFSSDGHAMSQGSISPNDKINIARLPTGAYIITIHPDQLPSLSASFIKL